MDDSWDEEIVIVDKNKITIEATSHADSFDDFDDSFNTPLVVTQPGPSSSNISKTSQISHANTPSTSSISKPRQFISTVLAKNSFNKPQSSQAPSQAIQNSRPSTSKNATPNVTSSSIFNRSVAPSPNTNSSIPPPSSTKNEAPVALNTSFSRHRSDNSMLSSTNMTMNQSQMPTMGEVRMLKNRLANMEKEKQKILNERNKTIAELHRKSQEIVEEKEKKVKQLEVDNGFLKNQLMAKSINSPSQSTSAGATTVAGSGDGSTTPSSRRAHRKPLSTDRFNGRSQGGSSGFRKMMVRHDLTAFRHNNATGEEDTFDFQPSMTSTPKSAQPPREPLFAREKTKPKSPSPKRRKDENDEEEQDTVDEDELAGDERQVREIFKSLAAEATDKQIEVLQFDEFWKELIDEVKGPTAQKAKKEWVPGWRRHERTVGDIDLNAKLSEKVDATAWLLGFSPPPVINKDVRHPLLQLKHIIPAKYKMSRKEHETLELWKKNCSQPVPADFNRPKSCSECKLFSICERKKGKKEWEEMEELRMRNSDDVFSDFTQLMNGKNEKDVDMKKTLEVLAGCLKKKETVMKRTLNEVREDAREQMLKSMMEKMRKNESIDERRTENLEEDYVWTSDDEREMCGACQEKTQRRRRRDKRHVEFGITKIRAIYALAEESLARMSLKPIEPTRWARDPPPLIDLTVDETQQMFADEAQDDFDEF